MELDRLREENRHLRGLVAERENTAQTLSATEPPLTEHQLLAQTHDLTITRAALEQRERLVDNVLSSIVDFTYVLDHDSRFTYVNQALLNLWQLKLDEAVGKNFFDLGYPRTLATRLHQQIQTVFETGQTVRDETPYVGAAGITGYYEYIFVPVLDKNGKVEEVAGSTRDLSDRYREQMEKETLLRTLRVERERLTSLFMQAPAFIVILRGPEHVIEIANPLYHQLVGLDREIIGKPLRAAFPDVEGQGFFEILDEVYQTGKPFIGKDMRIVFQMEADAAPHEHYLDFIYQPLVEADGSITGIFVHGVDLTERKSTELQLIAHTQEIEHLNARLRRSMTETHHRVKNNLQVVAAMIDMQMMEYRSAQTVPLVIFEQLKAHIHTLSIVHDFLTKGVREDEEAQCVSAKMILDQLLPMLHQTAWNQAVSYRVEEAQLTSKQCVSLALILNELVTNALKHGKNGANVVFRVEEGRAILEVADDGPGFPAGFSPVKSASMGLELVESLIRTDLKGSSCYENEPGGGGHVTLSFPLPYEETILKVG